MNRKYHVSMQALKDRGFGDEGRKVSADANMAYCRVTPRPRYEAERTSGFLTSASSFPSH